jgi:hypothetical protein
MSVTVWMPKIDVGEGLDPYKIDVGEGLGPQNRCRSAFEFPKSMSVRVWVPKIGDGLNSQNQEPSSPSILGIQTIRTSILGTQTIPAIDFGNSNADRHRF